MRLRGKVALITGSGTGSAAPSPPLLDHVVGPLEQRRGKRQPERPGRGDVEHELDHVTACTGSSAGRAPLRIRST